MRLFTSAGILSPPSATALAAFSIEGDETQIRRIQISKPVLQ